MKQPNWRIPLVLAFCLLALGSFAYWLRFSHKPKTDHADTQAKKPLALAEDAQIAQFRFKSANGVIEGKCQSLAQKTCKVSTLGDWSITYPVTVKGDAETIKEALNNAATMIASETIDLKEETPEKRKALLEEYGLNDEKRTKVGTEFIELTLEDGKKLDAWFGEPYPIGEKVFVGASIDGKMNEDTIFIMPNFYKKVFENGVTHFRDKTILSFNRNDIIDITAQTSKDKFTAHLDNGNWIINEKKGDHDRIETILSSISQARAKEFVPEDLLHGAKSIAKYEFKSKTKSYWLELFEKVSKPIPLKGHSDVPGETHDYVKSSELTEPVEVDPAFRNQIDKKASELRYALLLSQTEKITSTTLKFEGKNFTAPAEFHYDGKNWAQKSTGAKLDATKVNNLLETISTAHALDIVAPAPAVPSDSLTVSIGDDKNAIKSHFVLYSLKDKNYAKDLNQSVNEAFVITPAEKNAFPFSPDSWKLK